MEEIKKKKKIEKADEEVAISDYSITPKKSAGKQEFEVILVTDANVVYKVGKDSNAFTKNIWGKNLKIGDKISI